MNKYSVLPCLIALLVALTMTSCSRDLDYSIWNPDPDDPNLPAYSEWGYNTFGAEYGRGYFLYDQYMSAAPFQITYKKDTLTVYMNGRKSTHGEMVLKLVFPYPQQVTDYTDLLSLAGQKIDLTASGCKVYLTDYLSYNKPALLSLTQGSFEVRRAQRLRVDGEEKHLILSGVFELEFLTSEGLPEALSKGRFDIALKAGDFHAFTD